MSYVKYYLFNVPFVGEHSFFFYTYWIYREGVYIYIWQRTFKILGFFSEMLGLIRYQLNIKLVLLCKTKIIDKLAKKIT